MSRDALVIGINTYQHLPFLRSPAQDAEAIAQQLEQNGNFQVWRLPQFLDPFESYERRVAQNSEVTLAQIEEALVRLFKPEGEHIPDTALFYFSGHGLRKNKGIQEGYLATSDANPDEEKWGLSLQWLRRLLQASPVRQQVIWLDCCYSGELLNFEEADPGNRGQGGDRCFITASREFEVAYAEAIGQHSVLTEALLQGLDPAQRADGVVTNFTVTAFLEDHFRTANQRPLFANSGSKIILTGCLRDTNSVVVEGVCPYRALNYFDCNDTDPQFFFGRTALIDVLLEKVRTGNFLAVVGASGSGKSSVIRAGLIHQLRCEHRLSGSGEWSIYLLRPGHHPLQSLANAFLDTRLSIVEQAEQVQKLTQLISAGATGLGHLVAATPYRLILVIDQFEECFTQCRDPIERQQFFECLIGALNLTGNKLCVVIALRADFFGKCLEAEYAGLAKQIEDHLIAVTPLNSEELEQAIVEPAKRVGLDVEYELVTQIITDVDGSPGTLPLLQYTLTELWEHRAVNWLTFAAYTKLGGVRGTLQQRAEELFASLNPSEQEITKYIFLELTQFGEGTEDTRRQVPKRELICDRFSEIEIDAVIQRLLEARLIVTTELVEKSVASHRVEVVDVAHEALIRYWFRLRNWVEENRIALQQKRQIEAAAETWLAKGKPTEAAYLLQGSKLRDALAFRKQYRDYLPLSSTALDFLGISRRGERIRKGVIITFSTLIAGLISVAGLRELQSRQTLKAIFLVNDPAKVTAALPQFFDAAQELQTNPSTEQIDRALSYYRQIMVTTSDVLARNPREFKETLIEAHHQAETQLATLLEQYRMNELKRSLDPAHPQFGEVRSNAEFNELQNQFTEGALQNTYKLLMTNYGVGADLNQDGLLSHDEAQLLPCETLREIEVLWKQTKTSCTWNEASCIKIHIDQSSFTAVPLAQALFDYQGMEHAIDRINACSLK